MNLPPAVSLALGFACLVFVFLPTRQYTVPLGESLKEWSTAPDTPGTVTKGFLLTDFDDALHVAAAYLVVVFIGLFFKNDKKEDGQANPTVDGLVKAIQLAYNLLQVIIVPVFGCSVWNFVSKRLQSYPLHLLLRFYSPDVL